MSFIYNFFYDTYTPTKINDNYKHNKTTAKISSSKPGLLRTLTNFLGISVRLKERTITVSSVANYICDVYFTNLSKKEKKEKLSEIKDIIKQKSDKNIQCDELIKNVVLGIAEKEKISDSTISDIATKALTPPEILDDAKNLEEKVVTLSNTNTLLHIDTKVANNLHKHVEYLTHKKTWEDINKNFSSEIPVGLKDYLIPDPSHTSTYSQIKMNLETLEKFCKLQHQLNKEYMNKTATNWSDINNQLLEIAPQLSLSNMPAYTSSFENIKASLEKIAISSLKGEISRLGDKSALEGQTIEDLEKRWNALRQAQEKETLNQKLVRAKQNLPENVDVKTLTTPEEITSALTVFEAKIINLCKQTPIPETLKDVLGQFTDLLAKSEPSYLSSLKSLFNQTKELPEATKRLVEHFSHVQIPFDTATLKESNLPPEIYTIIALRTDLTMNVRLKAASLSVNNPKTHEKGIELLQTLLQQALQDKELNPSIILNELSPLALSLLQQIFTKDLSTSLREPLRLLTFSANNKLQKNLATALGINFGPIEEKEKWISSSTKNTIILSTPAQGSVETYGKELAIAVSRLRETQVNTPPIHAFAIGGQGNFVANTKDEYVDILNKLKALSSQFRGITLIPGKISYNNKELVPIFEDGRMISLARPPFTFLLTPAGTSLALGLGEEPLGELQERLPFIPNQVDVQIAIETNGRDDAPPINHSKGSFVRVTKEEKVEIESSAGESGNPVSKIPVEGINPFKFTFPANVESYLNKEIEDPYLFKGPEDKQAFLDSLQTGIFPPEYAHQFLVLFSRIKGPDHSVVVYTENPSMPVEIYRNGQRNTDIKDPELIFPHTNCTLLAYSSGNNAFYEVSPSLAEETLTQNDIKGIWNKFKSRIGTVIEEGARSANSVPELQKTLKSLQKVQNDLVQWVSSPGSAEEFYWKKKNYQECKDNLSSIQEFCDDIIEVFTLKGQKLIDKLDYLQENHINLQNNLKAFLGDPEAVTATTTRLTRIPRAWDTVDTLMRLGETPTQATNLTVQNGRLVLNPSPTTTNADTIKETLSELQESLLSLKLAPEEIASVEKGLTLFITPTSKQQQGIIPGFRSFPSWHSSSEAAKKELTDLAQEIINSKKGSIT